jgi:hypothetical protein
MARFRQFTKRQLWQRFLVQKVPTFYTIVDKNSKILVLEIFFFFN